MTMNQLLIPKIKGSIINNLNQIVMRRYLLTFLSLVLFLGQSLCLSAQTQTKESKLLMTIGCISDSHCEYGLLTGGDANTVKMRRTFTTTMAKMKQEENLDVILVGGDVTGLSSASQSNWERSRELFVDGIASAFNTGHDPHVLVAAGNHEYQAGGGGNNWGTRANFKYNSADYYSLPMKEWNGELDSIDSRECYYESPSSAPKVRFLAAYHYNIKGVDFVVLNTAKYLYESCDDYSYSKESAQWCVKKIDELYKKNPNGTVFFVMHIPFGDSNSISKESKGISSMDGASDTLKIGLARHPNTIVLYGHDHGGDKAYSTQKTSQRLTRYDTSGNKMSSITDINHVDGTVQSESASQEPSNASFITLFMGSMRYYENIFEGKYSNDNDTVAAKVIQALIVYVYNDRIEMRLKNYGETGTFKGEKGKGYEGKSVTINEELTPYTIFRNVVLTTDDDDDEGGEGGEGGDDNPGTDPDPITSDVYYKLATDGEWLPAEITNRSLTLTDATWKGISTEEEIEFDAINYVRLFKSLGWQALYVPFEFTVTEDNLKAFEIAKIQGAIAEEDGCTSISYVPLQVGDVVKANTPYVIKARKANSKTAQTLVAEDATLKVPVETGFSVKSATDIYEFNGIYNDKVAEKDAKWYALNSGGTYQHMSKGVVLQPFRIFMNLTPRDDNPYAAKSAPATNQNAKVYYRASIGGAWQEAQISNNTITIDDVNWKGIKADGNRLFSAINYSRFYKSTEWQAWYVPFDLKLTNQILKNFSFAKIQGAIADEDGEELFAYVRLKAGDVLNANTPYVIKAKTANSTTPQVISVNNAILQVPANNNGFTVSSASDEYGFYGVSDTRVSTDEDWDQWYAINLSGTYQRMLPGVYLQPFRIYMTINPRENSPYELSVPQNEVKIRVFGDDFDEADPTAINEINVDAQQQTGKWYNVQGMEVNAPSKGIYIKDGKKYLF